MWPVKFSTSKAKERIVQKAFCLFSFVVIVWLAASSTAKAQGFLDNGHYNGNHGRTTVVMPTPRHYAVAPLSPIPEPPREEVVPYKGCCGRGRWCLVPEVCIVRVPKVVCIEKRVCCPQLVIGPCGIGFQNVERIIRVPTMMCVEQKITRYRWAYEPCTCR